jgi:hypothetical protein
MTLDTTTEQTALEPARRGEGDLSTIGNVRVGKPQVDPAAPAHTRGVREGNRVRKMERVRGLEDMDAWSARGSAERSTGINPDSRNPIDPRSPNLSPA